MLSVSTKMCKLTFYPAAHVLLTSFNPEKRLPRQRRELAWWLSFECGGGRQLPTKPELRLNGGDNRKLHPSLFPTLPHQLGTGPCNLQ